MKQREIILDMGKAAFVVLAVKVMASTSLLIPWNPTVDNLCIVFALAVLLVKLCTITLTLGKLIGLAAVSLAVLYSCVSIGQYDLLISLIAVCLLINEDIDEYISMLLRTQIYILAAHIVLATMLSLTGSDHLYWSITDSRLRFNGGFAHANVLSSYITSCMLMFAWTHFREIAKNQWGWMSAVTVLSYGLSRSRTGLMLNILLLVLVYLAQKDNRLLRSFIKPVLLLSFPALAAFVYWVTQQYLNNNGLAVFVDDLLTGRIKYAAYAYIRSGTTWLPRYLDYAESGLVVWTPEWNLNTFTFDNLYSFCFMQLGMVWIVLFTVMIAIVCLRSDYKAKIFALVWVLFSMVEVHGLNCFKFFPILLFSTLFSREGADDEPDS